MSVRAGFVLTLSWAVTPACSLEYLDEQTDASESSTGLGHGGSGTTAAGSSAGGGGGGCACDPVQDGVLYEEDFDGPGWCNDNLEVFQEPTSAIFDPDATNPSDGCQSLHIGCQDVT